MSLNESVELSLLPGYVEQADGGDVRLRLLDQRLAASLCELGCLPTVDPAQFRFICGDEQDKARLFTQLRQLGLAFAAGREWSPSDVFEYLRDQGLLRGIYRRLIWTSPGRMHVSLYGADES